MITGLDHIVVLLEDIKAGTAAYERLLGCAPSWRNSGEGADRVLFSVDYPFEECSQAATWFDTCGLPQDVLERIARTNAAQLFGVK